MRLGDHGDDALHLVLQLVIGPRRQHEPLLRDARVDVLEDDRRAHPRGHRRRLAGHGEPPRLDRLRVEPRRLPDPSLHLGEHLAAGISRIGRGPERALRPALRRPAVERELAERGPHAAPGGTAVTAQEEGRRRHRLGGVRARRRRVLATANVGVTAERVSKRVETIDGRGGDGDGQACLVGEPRGERGRGLMHGRGDRGVDHEDETTRHALAVGRLTVCRGHRRGIIAPPRLRAPAASASTGSHARRVGGAFMVIEGIEIYRVRVPLAFVWKTSYGDQHNTDTVLVRMESQGHHAWGESCPPYIPNYSAEHTLATFHTDCNAAYTLADLDLFRTLDRYRLAMIEQPLADDGLSLVNHAELQSRIETPVCLDESALSLAHVKAAIQMKACRVINIKVARVGGLTASRDIQAYCAQHSVPCWVGGMLETAIGGAICAELATLPNFTYAGDIFPSSYFYRDDLGKPEIVLSGRGEIATSRGSPRSPTGRPRFS